MEKGQRRPSSLAQGHTLPTKEQLGHLEPNNKVFGKWARRNDDKPEHTQIRRDRFWASWCPHPPSGQPWQGCKGCLFNLRGKRKNPTPEEEKEGQEKTLLDLGGIFIPFWGPPASPRTPSFNSCISGRGHWQAASRLPAGHRPSASAAATTTHHHSSTDSNPEQTLPTPKLQLIKDK